MILHVSNSSIFTFNFNRDEENIIVSELRSIHKSFSDDLLHQKLEKKKFRAKPVPIESRIPLYDKILEDQAMRYVTRFFLLQPVFYTMQVREPGNLMLRNSTDNLS